MSKIELFSSSDKIRYVSHCIRCTIANNDEPLTQLESALVVLDAMTAGGTPPVATYTFCDKTPQKKTFSFTFGTPPQNKTFSSTFGTPPRTASTPRKRKLAF